ERCGEPGQDVDRCRGRGLLRQPRHLRDALRGRARPGRGPALRARAVRGRRYRRGRR
ncbi:MAG: Thiamine pyrophosphate-requiring enzymes, partial [uncultured Rubrobacteraceae bacterium]